MSNLLTIVSTAQVNASLALSDRTAYGVSTVEEDGIKADGSIKSILIQWTIAPVFDTANKLTFFRLSYFAPKGKNKGELVESARLQPSKKQGFSITFQDKRLSAVDAIAKFTMLDQATQFVQTNVLPPSYFQLAFVYANCGKTEITDLDGVKTLVQATEDIWKAALETGSRLLPQYFPKAIAASEPATVATTATEVKPAK